MTCACGGLAVIRDADVICQSCGVVLMTRVFSTSMSSSTPFMDAFKAGELWNRIRDRINSESAEDAKFLKSLGIKPLDE